MQLAPDPFNLVVRGQWNQAIFSPDWVRTHLRQGQDQVTLALPVNNPAAPFRVSFDSFSLHCGAERLEIHTTQALTPASVTACQQLAIQILQLLPHTPVTAVGMNVRVLDTDNPDRVYAHFAYGDAGRMPADRYVLQWTDLRRKYRVSDHTSLNLSIGYDPQTVRMEFNYHSDVARSQEAVERLTNPPCAERLAEVHRFLETVYGSPIAVPEQAAA